MEEQLALYDDLPGTTDPRMGTSDPGATPLPVGQLEPRFGQSQPRLSAGDFYAFDWSEESTRGLAVVDPAGMRWGRVPTLNRLLHDLPRNADILLIGECTFDSYHVRQREQDMALAGERGITLLTVPTRENNRRRAKTGLPKKEKQSRETDYEDALAIRQAVMHGAHVKKPGVVDPAWAALRIQARSRLRDLRRFDEKDEYAKDVCRRLPPFMLQPYERRTALGCKDPKDGYNLIILAAAGVACEFVSSRDEFEKLMGLYGAGYPSQFRSDLYHWGWGRTGKPDRITISAWRREIRWLYGQLRR